MILKRCVYDILNGFRGAYELPMNCRIPYYRTELYYMHGKDHGCRDGRGRGVGGCRVVSTLYRNMDYVLPSSSSVDPSWSSHLVVAENTSNYFVITKHGRPTKTY